MESKTLQLHPSNDLTTHNPVIPANEVASTVLQSRGIDHPSSLLAYDDSKKKSTDVLPMWCNGLKDVTSYATTDSLG